MAADGGGGTARRALRAVGRAVHWVVTGGARKPRYVDLGEFKAPPEVPLAPIERVVEEGHLIAASAVRMAVKNRLLVAALRDDREYDPDALTAVARRQFTELASENEDAADRLEREQRREAAQAEGKRPRRYLGGRPIVERPEQVRGPRVYRMLAEALRATAADEEQLLAVVESARDDAWEELGHEVEARLDAEVSGEPASTRTGLPASVTLDPNLPVDADYARERDQRMRELIDVDLAALAAPHRTPTA